MRKLLGYILVLLIPLLSCTKSDSDPDVITQHDTIYIEKPNTDYYVKYHYVGDGGYHYCTFNIKYINSVTPNSNPATNTISYTYPETKSTHIDNEIICGPFKRNDRVSLEMLNEQSVETRLLEIYISKDNSPFALRKSTNEKRLEYIIDY